MTWHERIERAKMFGGFTREDVDLSLNWTTCACGEQDPRIPRRKDGTPWDDDLTIYGAMFHDFVKTNRMDLAERMLEDIERQAVKVIEEWIGG